MLNYEYPPLGGGAGNATKYILKEFAHIKDINVDLVTSSAGAYRVEEVSDNVKIHFIDIKKTGNLQNQSYLDLLKYSFHAYGFCKTLIKEKQYALCHAFFGVPCGAIALKLQLPYIVSLRGSDVPYNNPKYYYLEKAFLENISKKVWEKSRAVIANSAGLQKKALETYPGLDVKVIWNGVDTERFVPKQNRAKSLKVLCVSRLTENKGIENLIKAVANLKNNDIKLTIAGTGREEKRLKRMVLSLKAGSKIVFTGHVQHGKLASIYQQNDVFVLPSKGEGMSNTVLEAMACGLPIMITDTGGTAELLKGNGFKIEKMGSKTIEQYLIQLMRNPELRSEFGKKSRELALGFSWKNCAEKYYKIYRRLCA